MSWGLKVPDGWVKGEPLLWWGGGPRYACSARRTLGEPAPEYMVTFDNLSDAEAFRNWWRSDQVSDGAG